MNGKKINLVVEQLFETFWEKKHEQYSITDVDLSMFDMEDKYLILKRYAEKIFEGSFNALAIGWKKEYLTEVKKACVLAEACKGYNQSGTKALFDFLEKNYK